MLLDENQDLFNTPTLMYYSLKKEFDRKYLNPQLWKHEYGTKESIRSYDDLLRYLEKTEEFRDLDNSLKTSIPSDNVHLVLYVLPLPPKRREDLFDFVFINADKQQSPEDKLDKIKKYFEKRRSSGLLGLEDKLWKEIERYRESSKFQRNENTENQDIANEDKKVQLKTKEIEVIAKKSVKVKRKKALKGKDSHDNKKSAVVGREKSEAESTKENERFVKVEVVKHKFVKNKKKAADIKSSVKSVNNEYKDIKTDKRYYVKKEEKLERESELLDIRQMIYSKLKQGIYVKTILRTFKHKVEQYLMKYRTSLSYYQEKTWRAKIVITEKAVKRYEKDDKTRYKVPLRQKDHEDEINPAVEEMFDAARKQELVIESLPNPPQDDLEKRLSKLKKFNRRLLDGKKVKIAECEAEVTENGGPKVVTKRVQVTENKTEVIDIISINPNSWM